MTTKSQSRRDRDAKNRKELGITGSQSFNRSKSARAWYDLKMAHARTNEYIVKLANNMLKYANVPVFKRISEKGLAQEFMALQKQIIAKQPAFVARLTALWDSHKDKKKLCLSITELEAAMNIMHGYETFDTEFYFEFSPIVSKMNEIFNGVLDELIAEQNAAAADTARSAIETVNKGVTENVQLLPEKMEDLSQVDSSALANAFPGN